MRVALHSLLDLQGLPIHPAPHIGVPGCDPHPDTGGNRDHWRSALTTAAANSGGVNTGLRTRAAPANSIFDCGCRAPHGIIIAIVIDCRDNHLGEAATSATQLLAPAIDVSGTNVSPPGDISDNRPRGEVRLNDRALFPSLHDRRGRAQ
jgi:hypothetical protein